MSHIKGPWRYVDFGSAGTVVTSGPIDICLLHVYRPKDEQISNAKLIAAAPDLLEALRNIIEIGKRDLSNDKYEGYFVAAEEAIKKATT